MHLISLIPHIVAGLGILFVLTVVIGLVARSLFEFLEDPAKRKKAAFLVSTIILGLLKALIAIGGSSMAILLMPIVSALIKIDSPGPLFYKPTYCGSKGKKFTAHKFRTMVADANAKIDELQHLNELTPPFFYIKDDPRITRVGKFLRKTGIDELPLLIHVLKGDMDIVGPRLVKPNENILVKPNERIVDLYSGKSLLNPAIFDATYKSRYEISLSDFTITKKIINPRKYLSKYSEHLRPYYETSLKFHSTIFLENFLIAISKIILKQRQILIK